MLELFTSFETWVSLTTLTALEIVLGIDNVVFISILTGKLPQEKQDLGRKVGLMMALLMRILLLLMISWIVGLVKPLFVLWDFEVSGRDLILFIGGLFLIAKSTSEIHNKLEGGVEDHLVKEKKVSFAKVIFQIMMLDVVFSLDSVITAVGLVDHVIIMIIAVILSLIVMLVFSKTISDFVHRHPTMKMLALAFLLMIGVLLVVEGLHVHVPKGYIYFAMAFSLFVEILNLRATKKAKPVAFHGPKYTEE